MRVSCFSLSALLLLAGVDSVRSLAGCTGMLQNTCRATAASSVVMKAVPVADFEGGESLLATSTQTPIINCLSPRSSLPRCKMRGKTHSSFLSTLLSTPTNCRDFLQTLPPISIPTCDLHTAPGTKTGEHDLSLKVARAAAYVIQRKVVTEQVCFPDPSPVSGRPTSHNSTHPIPTQGEMSLLSLVLLAYAGEQAHR